MLACAPPVRRHPSRWQGFSDLGPAQAQMMIGGPNGVVIGGGRGVSIGGRDGVNFRRGLGWRFGPPGAGLQVGGGQGFRAGTPYEGLQMGAGQGFRAGTPYEGFQFGNGQGMQAGQLNPPAYPATIPQPANYPPGYVPQPVMVGPNAVAPSTSPGVNAPTPANGSAAQPTMQPAAARPAEDVDRRPRLDAPVPDRQQLPAENVNGVVSPPRVPDMIVLKYPADARRSLQYSVNGTSFQLAPGNSVRMKSGQDWRVGIPMGRGQRQEFTIREAGNYLVDRTESGWTINSENGQPVVEVESPRPEPTQPPNPAVAPQPTTTKPVPDQTKQEAGDETKSVLEFNDSKGK